jgi:hypothetical protein
MLANQKITLADIFALLSFIAKPFLTVDASFRLAASQPNEALSSYPIAKHQKKL